MSQPWNPTKTELVAIQEQLDQGKTTITALLKEHGILYPKFRKICESQGVRLRGHRGKVATTYTLDKYHIVKARIEKGEFVRDVVKELGMEYRNFCRFCRQQGLTIHTPETLKLNYSKRKMKTGKKVWKKKPGRKPLPPGDPYKSNSKRTKEIVRMLEAGRHVSEIAAVLSCTKSNVYEVEEKLMRRGLKLPQRV